MIRSMNFDNNTINEPDNAMTLSFDLHRYFGNFRSSFEKTVRSCQLPFLIVILIALQGAPHQYAIKKYSVLQRKAAALIPHGDCIATFISFDESIPLPDPTLLEIHAVIARTLLHAAGKGLRIEQAALRRFGVDGFSEGNLWFQAKDLQDIPNWPVGFLEGWCVHRDASTVALSDNDLRLPANQWPPSYTETVSAIRQQDWGYTPTVQACHFREKPTGGAVGPRELYSTMLREELEISTPGI